MCGNPSISCGSIRHDILFHKSLVWGRGISYLIFRACYSWYRTYYCDNRYLDHTIYRCVILAIFYTPSPCIHCVMLFIEIFLENISHICYHSPCMMEGLKQFEKHGSYKTHCHLQNMWVALDFPSITNQQLIDICFFWDHEIAPLFESVLYFWYLTCSKLKTKLEITFTKKCHQRKRNRFLYWLMDYD